MMGVLISLFLFVTLGSAATPLTYESEFSSVIPPTRLFKATVLDEVNFIPKIGSKIGIKTVEVLEGDGGVGTVKKITFSQGGKINYAKQKTEAIDKDKLVYKYSLIEGEDLNDELEKITYEITYVAGPDGGTVIKSVEQYYTKDEESQSTFEEEVKQRKENVSMLFKIVDQYLLDNPGEYN